MDCSCITKIPSAVFATIAGAGSYAVAATKQGYALVASKTGAVFQRVVPYLAAVLAFATSNLGLSVILLGATVAAIHSAANTNEECEIVTYVALGLFAFACSTSLFLGKGFAATKVAALRAACA